jgi:hypothetical protein
MRALAVAAAVAVVVTFAGLVPALALAGRAQGKALLFYALFLVALVLALLVDRLRKAMPPAPRFLRRRARAADDRPTEQFERLEQALVASSWSESHLYSLLRPIAREIVATRLRRHHGVDLDRSPERAHAIVGDGYAWSLVRPDRESPANASGHGWSRGELRKLLDELERL